MNQLALQKQLEELSREFRHSGDAVEQELVQLRAEIDRCKFDMAAVVKFIESRFPDFWNEFETVRQRARFEVDPASASSHER